MTDDQVLDAILDREAGYADDPADRGRATAWGISSRYHPEAWTHGPPSREQAKAIYRRDYLAPFAAVEPIELRAQVVDIAVNSGVTTARALLALASNQTRRAIGVQLVVERLRHYARLVKGHPDQRMFLTGWISRACEFL